MRPIVSRRWSSATGKSSWPDAAVRFVGIICVTAFCLCGLRSRLVRSSQAASGATQIALHVTRASATLAPRLVGLLPALQRCSTGHPLHPAHSPSLAAGESRSGSEAGEVAGVLAKHAIVHAGRTRWRAYDANAPPCLLRFQS